MDICSQEIQENSFLSVHLAIKAGFQKGSSARGSQQRLRQTRHSHPSRSARWPCFTKL